AGSASLNTIVEIDGSPRGDCEWVVDLKFVDGFEPFREHCAWSRGLFKNIPVLFGLSADVVEEHCQCDGHATCMLRVRWSDDAGSEATYLEQRVRILASQLESLQETVSDLVSGEGLEHVLPRIVASASRALHAPSFVLALDPTAPTDRRVFSLGLDE